VGSRADAIALLENVSAFYRRSEPASPIPLLVDRAVALATKDFVTLLQDFLPAEPDDSASRSS
jgi:type VI secretion system protein ImpA